MIERTAEDNRRFDEDMAQLADALARKGLNQYLTELAAKLKTAFEAARDWEIAAREAGYEQPAGECGAYLVGWLEGFLANKNQPGSIPSLRSSLDQWEMS